MLKVPRNVNVTFCELRLLTPFGKSIEIFIPCLALNLFLMRANHVGNSERAYEFSPE